MRKMSRWIVVLAMILAATMPPLFADCNSVCVNDGVSNEWCEAASGGDIVGCRTVKLCSGTKTNCVTVCMGDMCFWI